MLFAKRIFLVAGLYGLVVLLPQFFLEQQVGRDYPPPVTHPEFFYGFVGVGLAWQVAFLIIARDPVRYRPLMIPCVLEKLSFGVAVLVLYFGGRVSGAVLSFGLVDLAFAVLFCVAYARTPPAGSPPG